MDDSLSKTTVSVDFKIEPNHIPSSAIRRLEQFAHSSGGIGDVWKCSMVTKSGRSSLVAIHSIRTAHTDDDESLRKTSRKIRREASVWIQLSHDHILPLEGITDDFGRLPALVSQWMDNGNLSSYLKKEFSRLSGDRKLELVRQVAMGLNYLHEKCVVHGDLTGTNILVDDFGNLRISDFGLSMIVVESENLTFGSVQTGNTRWMAPECLNFSGPGVSDTSVPKPTTSGDVYSFGCVMLQILSGAEPYSEIRFATRVMFAILSGLHPFSKISMDIDEKHRLISSQCLSRKPADRPLISDIVTVLGLPVSSAQVESGSQVTPEAMFPKYITKTANYPIAHGGSTEKEPRVLLDVRSDSIYIPSEVIRTLARFPRSSGVISDVWKCSMTAASGSRLVAVKTIRSAHTNDEESLRRTGRKILHEAHVWVGLSHTHIIPLAGITDSFGVLPALVSLWMERGTLSNYIKNEFSKLTESRKSELIQQVAAGLSYLHIEGIVHGTLSGSNILLDDSGNLRLADFALSTIAFESENFTFDSVQMGSARWMAPESLNRSGISELPPKATTSGDVYSFGCIMLQILSGEEPYSRIKSVTKTMSAILRGVEPFSGIKINMNERYRLLSSRCLSGNREERPSILEVIITLDSIVLSLESTSRPIFIPIDGSVSSHSHETRLFVDLYPVQDLGPPVDGLDASLGPLKKYTEGDNFDLQGISDFLCLPDLSPKLQCAALQLLEHAAEWQHSNFDKFVLVTFHQVAQLLLDSRDNQVHCAAMDTLKRFLAPPHATDIVRSMVLCAVIDAISNNLDSCEPLVQLASVELLDVVAQSEEILVRFAPAVSCITAALPSMPTDTQVAALKILEISATSNTSELVKAIAPTFCRLIEPFFSPETMVQASVLKALKACARTKDPDLTRAAQTILPVIRKIQMDRQASMSAGEEDGISIDSIDEISAPIGSKPIIIPSTAIKKLGLFPDVSGGRGDIWKCSMSTSSGVCPVAVKSPTVPKEELLSKIGMRLCREAYLWSDLSHDRILHFEGITTNDDLGPLPALVSLWMENGSLNNYLKRSFLQLSDNRKLELIQQVAAGLSYLHTKKNVVHGNLTGSNILVDGSGNIRIADFGLSFVLTEAKSEMRSLSQTRYTRWTAPELVVDEQPKLTTAGDIYSFGCVMLQILSGKEPYSHVEYVEQVFSAMMAGQEPFFGVKIGLNDAHRLLSRRCLSRDPGERPAILEIMDILCL